MSISLTTEEYAGLLEAMRCALSFSKDSAPDNVMDILEGSYIMLMNKQISTQPEDASALQTFADDCRTWGAD